MPQTAAEIAKDLAIAAIHAHPAIVIPRTTGPNDERVMGAEIAALFAQIYANIRGIQGVEPRP